MWPFYGYGLGCANATPHRPTPNNALVLGLTIEARCERERRQEPALRCPPLSNQEQGFKGSEPWAVLLLITT